MSVGVVLFTRDLRIRDNPALWQAVHDHEQVLPVFVLDDAILASGFKRPNRAAFLAGCLHDLDESLRARGAGLIVRRGDVTTEVAAAVRRVRADAVHVASDVSGYAQRRERQLAARLGNMGIELVVHDDALLAVPPGRILPSTGARHLSVFAAYYRRWHAEPHRDPLPAPRYIRPLRRRSWPATRGARHLPRSGCAATPEGRRGRRTRPAGRLAAYRGAQLPRETRRSGSRRDQQALPLSALRLLVPCRDPGPVQGHRGLHTAGGLA